MANKSAAFRCHLEICMDIFGKNYTSLSGKLLLCLFWMLVPLSPDVRLEHRYNVIDVNASIYMADIFAHHNVKTHATG